MDHIRYDTGHTGDLGYTLYDFKERQAVSINFVSNSTISFSPDDQSLVAVFYQGAKLEIFDIVNRKFSLALFFPDENLVRCVSFSNDCKTLLLGMSGSCVMWVSMSDGSLLHKFYTQNWVTHITTNRFVDTIIVDEASGYSYILNPYKSRTGGGAANIQQQFTIDSPTSTLDHTCASFQPEKVVFLPPTLETDPVKIEYDGIIESPASPCSHQTPTAATVYKLPITYGITFTDISCTVEKAEER